MTEVEYDKAIAKAVEEYNSVRNTQPEAVVRAASAKIKELKKQRVALLSKGSKPCPKCHAAPIGMKRREGVYGAYDDVYEVGCDVCRDVRAQGSSIEIAMSRWNEQKFVPPRNLEEGPVITKAPPKTSVALPKAAKTSKLKSAVHKLFFMNW